MPLRRRNTASYSPTNLCNQLRETWAYNNHHYAYGPSPHHQSAPCFQPSPVQSPPSSQDAVISSEDDVHRLFNVCKVGTGNAELLNEVLVYAKPQELKNDITKELLSRARASHELVASQIPWATTEAERSRLGAQAIAETIQEQLLGALLSSHEQLTESLKMYDDLERIAIEQEAEERMKTERLIQALTAVSEYRPSPEETPLIGWVLSTGDPERTGKINPQTATRIFSASHLPPDALARIWEIASVDSKDGLLDRQGVGIALRLIGHAQKGATVTEGLVNRPGPLAELENISPIVTTPIAGPSTGFVFSSLPSLTTHDKAKFKKIFKASGAENGLLTGPQAREVFMKSKLPWNTLSEIWTLADTQRRGQLDVTDFTIAMYFIQALMTGKITSVPPSLPPYLYEEAAYHTPAPSMSQQTLSLPPPRHPSRASSRLSPGPPPPRHPSRSPCRAPSQTGSSFDISPATRVQADHIFSTLDPRNKGRVKGETIRAYIHQSGLSHNSTALIWELADKDRKGYLTRNEFAVAMHLVRVRKDGHHLPTALPPGHLQVPNRGDDDVYTGIVDEANMGVLRSTSHTLSRSEDRIPPTRTPPKSQLRSSRSTPYLPGLTAHPPLPSPVVPFPMSPLPGTSHCIPTQATSPSQWGINPEDRVRYDRHFEQLDTSRRGYLLSDVAVPFFARAKLPNDVMATIWDLADSEHDGRLTPGDFAVAMHLIRQKLEELKDTSATAAAAATLASPGEPTPLRQDNQPTPTLREETTFRPPPQPPQPPRRVSSESQPQPQLDPATVRLPDDSDDNLRSDTPPPPYELIAPDST